VQKRETADEPPITLREGQGALRLNSHAN